MKKIALVGRGKTGSFVEQALKNHSSLVLGEVFSSNNIVTVEKLKNHDGIIIFVNAHVLSLIMPTILQMDIPIVCATTGFDYQTIQSDLSKRSQTFLYGSNFSMGIHAFRKLMPAFKKTLDYLSDSKARIIETHHTKKLDSPSGTAKSIQDWYKAPIEIEALRLGDVVGIHKLIIENNNESLSLEHVAHNRALFADGAVAVMNKLLHKKIPEKFISIEDYFDHYLFNQGD